MVAIHVDARDGRIVSQAPLRQAIAACPPNRARAAAQGKPEGAVRAPRDIVRGVHQIVKHPFEIDAGHPFAYPFDIEHFRRMRPHLEVVRQHEYVGQTLAERGDNPLAEVARPRMPVSGNIDEARQATFQVLSRQMVNVILQRVGNEPLAHPDPRFPLVVQPALRPQKLIHHAIEVFVMGKLDVPADVPGEALPVRERRGQPAGLRGCLQNEPVFGGKFIQPPCGPKPRGACAENQDVCRIHDVFLLSTTHECYIQLPFQLPCSLPSRICGQVYSNIMPTS
jgi:hypothetical protein